MGRAKVRWGIAVAVLVLVADQLSKWAILTQVFALAQPISTQSWHPPIEITGFFDLVMVWNYGVSFGMFSGGEPLMRWGLVVLTLVIVIGLSVWVRRTHRLVVAITVSAIIGGAIGNLADRVRFGAVADFLDFHLYGWHWPAFNVADSAISIGVVLLLVDSLWGRSPGTHKDTAS